MGSQFLLLAFGFSSPLWLWGLGSIAVPIAIHLWRRQTPRVLEWGPMKYLREVLNRHARKMRIESLLILLVRCLLLALLAIAVARPFVESNSTSGEGVSRTHKVLLIDGSLSMSIREGDSSRMERARQHAREIVRSSSVGDTFQLCRIGNAINPVIIRRPARDREDVLREIDRLPQLDDAGDLVASLRQVTDLLSEIPAQQNIELFVVSDFQTTQWALDTPAEESQLRQRLQDLSVRGRLFLVDSGPDKVVNLSLRSLQVPEQVALSGRPFHVEVTVFNHSSEEQVRTVEILADRIVRFSQSVTVAAGAEQRVTATLQLPEIGSEVLLEARLPADALTTDNQIQRVVSGRKQLEVLLVDGRPSEKLSESASGFVRLAIAPVLSAGSGEISSPYVPTVISASEFSTTVLNRFDTIVICDVASLASADLTRLTKYVQQGGGVVLGAGDLIASSAFGENWSGLFPGTVQELVNRTDEPILFDTANLDHPILAPFRGRSDSGLATSPVSQYMKFQLSPDAGWHTVLPFASGDPAIAERTIGNGTVILVTTTLDDSWGHWVLWPSYLPLINRLLHFAMSGRIKSEPVLVGSPVRAEVLPGSEGTWTLPSARSVAALSESREGENSPNESILFWPETGTAGFYQLVTGSPQNLRKTFAVHAAPQESDPRTVSAESLRRGILAGVNFEWGTENSTSPVTTAMESASSQASYSRPLVWMALGLLIVEMLLAWRFRWGVIALAAVLLYGAAAIWMIAV